ncbi:uncharacterized protein LAJ45_03653 [Morchella importuna]|uniref:uncharacterized protein n=1 Tax=Morchella importuna TaxID=1174673 RepID=UPI001E8E765C|nr:uncharacterized protein LAJ45_03653 [Morchella importuna]KAH8152227.1 hypothetical protein LAJ45_03653 [Morchella importuna]
MTDRKPTAGAEIEVDNNYQRPDYSATDTEDTASQYSTASLTSSVYAYRYENGRRYHAFRDGVYNLPNDETEQDRLDIYHHIICMFHARHNKSTDSNLLLFCPVTENPQKILDLGTGTGIWAIDAGEKWPSAEVIGTDLSPIQPRWVPPNVMFQVDDAESEWTWGEEVFDIIHIRHLSGSIRDWDGLIQQCYRALKPGGWLDLCEFPMEFYSDDKTLEGSEMDRWYKLVQKGTEKTDQRFTPSALPTIMATTGFTDLRIKLEKQPIGTWPKDPFQKKLGAYSQMLSESGFEALGIAIFTRVLGMSEEECRKIIDDCVEEVRSGKVHSYIVQHFMCGRKPEED